MFKKKISYVDFNGTQRTEDFYFHLSVPEVTRLEAKVGGKPLEEYTKELVHNQDMEKMIQFIEDLVISSYGVKSDDGKRFLKGPKIREEFEYSQAYAELFEELLLKPDAARKFAEGIGTQTKNSKKRKTQKTNNLKLVEEAEETEEN